MRQLTTGFGNQESPVIRCPQPRFRRVAGLLAVAGVLGFGTANADEPASAGAKSSDKGSTVNAKSESESAAIPECLEKLKLTSQQQTQVKEIIRKYDGSVATVWNQFSVRYMQAITVETSLLAAIEDDLTEDQRQQVRAQRHKTAHAEKMNEGTNDQSKKATVKPASAVDDDLAGVGITLTSEQEATADKIHEKYRPQMRSLKRDIEGLHIRLVSLEADKLVAIEKVLTKEQLTELRTHRQNAPVVAKVASSKVEPAKNE